jgi:hypothetical protein
MAISVETYLPNSGGGEGRKDQRINHIERNV